MSILPEAIVFPMHIHKAVTYRDSECFHVDYEVQNPKVTNLGLFIRIPVMDCGTRDPHLVHYQNSYYYATDIYSKPKELVKIMARLVWRDGAYFDLKDLYDPWAGLNVALEWIAEQESNPV